MITEFDEMSAQALGLADAALLHIAETEQLTDAENDRIAANVLSRVNLTNAQSAVKIQHRKRRLRIVGALIAAAVTVGAIGLSVSGWLTYNKPLMQSFFGSLGDDRLAELELPEPQTFTNGIVNATVEASLRDSNVILVLMTFESADENNPIDWAKLMDEEARHHGDSLFFYNSRILDENGEPVGSEDNPAEDMILSSCGVCQYENHYHTASVEYRLDILNPDFDAESITLRFKNQSQGRLDVTVPLTPRLESAVFEAEDGKQMTVSPIWFRTSVGQLIVPMDLPWQDLILNRTDGTQTRGYLTSLGNVGYSGPDDKWSFSESMIYEVTEGMEFEYDNPETYNGFIDISDVDSIEWCEQIYYRKSE